MRRMKSEVRRMNQKTEGAARPVSSFILRPSSFSRRGFSFSELLFAVMILGIGFIMIAAIFPVGLTQSKANFDETHAAAVARGAIAQISAHAQASAFPSGGVTPLQVFNDTGNDDYTTKIAHANMIQSADPRYAWVGLYRRINKTAQVIVVVVNRSDPFDANPVATANREFQVNDYVRRLEPRPVLLDVATNGDLRLGGVTTGANTSNASAAGPGAFVIVYAPNIDDDAQLQVVDNSGNPQSVTATDKALANSRMQGRIFRLGTDLGGNIYSAFPATELSDGFKYNDGTEDRNVRVVSLDDAGAYIVGRNRVGSTGAPEDFEGPVMDVAIYTSFVALK